MELGSGIRGSGLGFGWRLTSSFGLRARFANHADDDDDDDQDDSSNDDPKHPVDGPARQVVLELFHSLDVKSRALQGNGLA